MILVGRATVLTTIWEIVEDETYDSDDDKPRSFTQRHPALQSVSAGMQHTEKLRHHAEMPSTVLA